MARFTVNSYRFDPYRNFKFKIKRDNQYSGLTILRSVTHLDRAYWEDEKAYLLPPRPECRASVSCCGCCAESDPPIAYGHCLFHGCGLDRDDDRSVGPPQRQLGSCDPAFCGASALGLAPRRAGDGARQGGP